MNINKKDTVNFFKSRQIAKEAIHIIETKAPYRSEYRGLNDYFLKNKNSNELIEILLDKEKMFSLTANYSRDEKYDGAKKLNHILKNRAKRRKIRILLYRTVSSVAAVVAIVSIMIYSNNKGQEPETVTHKLQPSSAPVLILASGDNIILDNTHQLELNDKAIEATNDKLTYKTNHLKDTEISYNTIVIPDKRTYTIQLEDSTEVFLNENSELRYPTKFIGGRREVFLKGEGYFIVSKSSKPFIVNSAAVTVKVYGTQFNVNAKDTSIIKTTLVSGSVGVSVNNRDEIRMKPNQMFTVNRITKINDTKEVDATKYIAWTMDCLRYDSDRLETILNELTYWYGVEFIFENDKNKNEILTASFFKDTNLETIVKLLSEITNLKFIREGGTYIVK